MPFSKELVTISTLHEQIVEHAWEQAALDFEYHRAIVKHRETFLAAPHSDVHAVIAQYWTGRSIPVAEFWAIAQMRTLWREGSISYCNIKLGGEPGGDCDIQRHRSFLQGEKKYFSTDDLNNIVIITGAVRNGAGSGVDDDGTLTLLSTAKLDVCADSISGGNNNGARCVPAGTRLPLEIGYTSASRTYMHLLQEGCVARWPYGKTVLSLLQADLCTSNPPGKKQHSDMHVASGSTDNHLPLVDKSVS